MREALFQSHFIGAEEHLSFIPEPAPSQLPMLVNAPLLAPVDEVELRAAYEEALFVSNPRLSSVNELDCVSCHVADRAHRAAVRVQALDLSGSDKAYSNPDYRIDHVDDGLGLFSQRAFGYFRTTASITERVINESAEVAAALNAMP